MKIERLLGITLYILNKGSVNGSELAEHFHVTRRTIIRDIDSLLSIGIPIRSEAGYKGGYSLKQEATSMPLSNAEYGLFTLERLKAVYGEEEVNKTYEKLKPLFLSNGGDPMIDINFSGIKTKDQLTQLIAELNGAVNNKRIIEFDYTESQNESRKVNLHPIKLLYKWYDWYLFGFDTAQEEYTLVKLTKIENVVISEQVFTMEYEAERLLEDYQQKCERARQTIVIKYPSRIAPTVEEYFSGSVVEETQEFIVKKVTIQESSLVTFSLILGLGKDLEVISPPSYRDKIRRHANYIVNKLENGESQSHSLD
ncbi:WYL domain-containing protein [Enterococcus sp. 669A]|uniref:WYL domain-containing protein n=1 Tax=Candidatus Enterococcus moelleringii TaxID=2815325 RepID=A0ABS3LB86_9ENTE|nr:WYL domain-containing protein [Enterococcus sp. 669A]MBO1306881.1 WYL domain-containing protein [Enterococcus sp. 669A]